MKKESIISAHGLNYYQGDNKILENINLDISKGEIYYLIGPNGAGKSSLFKILLGLDKPRNGIIKLFEKKITNINREYILHKLGALIEDPCFYSQLSVKQNLKIFGSYYDLDPAPDYKVLEWVNLKQHLNTKIKHLSTGMKQRLGIALTFLHNPSLIFLDEPTRGLDPEHIIVLRNLILQLNQEQDKTFVISSHILSESEKIATKFGFIKNGRIVFESTPNELKSLKKIKIQINKTVGTYKLGQLKEELKEAGVAFLLDNYTLTVLNSVNLKEILISKIKSISLNEYPLQFSSVTLEDLYRIKL